MKPPRNYAVYVAALYAAAAAGWIFVSGIFVAALPPALSHQLEISKGLGFVAVTSIALYFVVEKWSSRFIREQRHAEGAERVLQQVVDTVPVGVLLTADDGEITFLNPAAIDLLGTSGEECVGRKLDELCSPGGRSRITDFGELLRTGAFDGLEVCGDQEGEPKAVIARAAQVDPLMPGTGWVVALADITEAHRASERTARMMRGYRFISDVGVLINRARSAEQMLQAVCDLAVARGGYAGACATVESRDGAMRVVAVIGLGKRMRQAITEAAGRNEVSGARVLHQNLRDVDVDNDLAHATRNPLGNVAIGEGLGSSAALPLFETSGSSATITLYSTVRGFFGQDELLVLHTLRNDIAFGLEKLVLDQKRFVAEEALEHSEHNYRQLFESNPQPMWVYDRATLRFLAVNDAAVTKYGFTAEQFAEMSIRDVRPAEDVARLVDSLAHKPVGLDDAGFWTHRDAAGREFPVHIHSHSLQWAGHTAELVIPSEIARLDP